MSPVRTIFTFDFVVYVTAVVLGPRIVAVYQQCEVGKFVKFEGIVEVPVIQAVFVSRAGFTEV